jgi:isoquinoline 1-oxidoreductase beta subunit
VHELVVNGRTYRTAADPAKPLLWVLRDELGLKGTKYGCGVGVCGACVVLTDAVHAQLEGSVAFGLSAALKEEIRVGAGRVRQASFSDYPILTLAEMPAVETHIIQSDAEPGGVGEPAVPVVAPALANAVFAASGRRLRRLPLRLR